MILSLRSLPLLHSSDHFLSLSLSLSSFIFRYGEFDFAIERNEWEFVPSFRVFEQRSRVPSVVSHNIIIYNLLQRTHSILLNPFDHFSSTGLNSHTTQHKQ
jgi:hypothetical protein